MEFSLKLSIFIAFCVFLLITTSVIDRRLRHRSKADSNDDQDDVDPIASSDYFRLDDGHQIRSLTIDEYENLARDRLTSDVYDYVAGGGWQELTLSRNRDAFQKIQLYPRYLSNDGNGNHLRSNYINQYDFNYRPPTPRGLVLGRETEFPIGFAPTAFQRAYNTDGELSVARGMFLSFFLI